MGPPAHRCLGWDILRHCLPSDFLSIFYNFIAMAMLSGIFCIQHI